MIPVYPVQYSPREDFCPPTQAFLYFALITTFATLSTGTKQASRYVVYSHVAERKYSLNKDSDNS